MTSTKLRRMEPMIESTHLRVLIANEIEERLDLVAQTVSDLGHEVVGREIVVARVAELTARELPDIALVGLGADESTEHALQMITEIVSEATCPVIAILNSADPGYVREAARRGVFAYIVDSTPDELQSAIDVTLQRYVEFQNLKGAFGRRAIIEQAKGILMALHRCTADEAFALLRSHSQARGRKLADVAASVVETLPLLPVIPTREAVVPV